MNFKIFFPLLSKCWHYSCIPPHSFFYAILGIGLRAHCMLSRQVLSTGLFISSPSFFLSLCGRYAYKPSTNKHNNPLTFKPIQWKRKCCHFFLLFVAIYLDDDHYGPKAMLTKTSRPDLRTKPGVKQQRKREINSNQDPLLLSHSSVFYSQKNLGQNKRCCPQRFKDTQDNQLTMLPPFPVNHYHCHML